MKYPIKFEDIKNYLRVDFYDDNILIDLMIDTGKKYITDAVGKFDENNPRHNMILLAVVAHLYENRMLQGQSGGKITRIINSMLLQERLDYYDGEETED